MYDDEVDAQVDDSNTDLEETIPFKSFQSQGQKSESWYGDPPKKNLSDRKSNRYDDPPKNNLSDQKSNRYDDPPTKSWSDTESDCYAMDKPERGVAVIISNRHFKYGLRERTGTNLDAFKLNDMFDDLGFERIIQKDNLTTLEMIALMKNVSLNDFTKKDCFACVILSYGEEGYVFGTDGVILLDDLIRPFKGDNCPSLLGKPKLFFVQAGQPLSETAHDGVSTSSPAYQQKLKIPVEADILIVQSRFSGAHTWNSSRRPSLFVEALCNTIEKNKKELDILKMMTRVSKTMLNSPLPLDNKDLETLLPSVTTMLTKELYFTVDKH